MSTSDDLLSAAETVLASRHPDRNRIACWLGRAATERSVESLMQAKQLDPGRSSMRSKLSCLQTAYADQPDVATRACYVWSQLSEACHQHAYQLSPSLAEVEHLLAVVSQLEADARVR